jgi:hypothetical protein
VVGLIVGAIAIFAVRHPKNSGTEAGTANPSASVSSSATVSTSPSTNTSPTTTSSSPADSATATGSSSSSVSAVSLVVLNNTTTAGLAGQVAKQFEQAGWTVTKSDNYQDDIISTCAYYDPDVPGAKEAAQALKATFPKIKRILPQFTELASWHSPIVVILVQDWLN